MKPREWLGYTICLNDSFPLSERAIDLFAGSSIPLADTFGSSSDVDIPARSCVLVFGPRVEQERLLEVLDLLAQAEFPVHFLMASGESEHRKTILIGSYNLNHEPVAPLTLELNRAIRDGPLGPDELARVIRDASTVIPMTAR